MDDFERFAQTYKKLGEAIAQAFLPFIERVNEAVVLLHTAMRREYDAIGMPYGPSDDDMYRFLTDRAQMVNRVREVADQVARVQYHAEVRRKIAEGIDPGVALISTPMFDAWSAPLPPEILFRL